jgi:hypothetical protein
MDDRFGIKLPTRSNMDEEYVVPDRVYKLVYLGSYFLCTIKFAGSLLAKISPNGRYDLEILLRTSKTVADIEA